MNETVTSDIGRVLDGRYRLIEPIGEGGMGTVYRAMHLGLDRAVALKLLISEHTTGEEIRSRFDREAKTLASMSHPHIVTITDYGVADETPFLVMELLEGEPLDRVLTAEGALEPSQARHVFIQILRALAYAHVGGIAHRDLKPANVFLQRIPGSPDHVKLLDFGLAKFVGEEHQEREGVALTRNGAILGTPAYMSPEQATGQAADARSDVYAAGVLLFEMLAGRRPYEGETPEILRQHLIAPIPQIAERCETRTGTPELDAFLRQAMAKERQARFSDAREMLAAFDALPEPLVVIGEPRLVASHAERITSAPTVLAAGRTPSGRSDVGDSRARATAPTVQPSHHAEPAGGISAKAVLMGIAALVLVGALAVGGVVLAGTYGGGTVEPASYGGSPTDTATDTAGELGGAATTDDGEGEGDDGLEELVPPDEEDVPTVEVSPGVATPLPMLNPSPGLDREPPPPAPATPIDSSASPWSRGTPRALHNIKRTLDRGRPMSASAERALRNYVRDHNDDPRGYLLLGRGYAKRGWRPDALERYERAYRLDPASKNDRNMLSDLVDLASHANVATRTQALVREVYGASAVTAIDRRLGGRDLDSSDRARLQRFRATLAP